MAELKRKDNELTTADLAGRTETTHDFESKPQLVRDDQRREPAADPRLRDTTATAIPLRSEGMAGRNEPTPVRGGTTADHSTPLFQESEVGDFRTRWSSIQTAFVDEPRRAVEEADNLVASLMKKLAEGFANERSRLEGQWDRGDNVSTEDLRIAFQRYRAFFDRLLKV